MVSPDDIILDEPERFIQRLEFKKIEESKNPQKEFLKQMEKRWNQKAGLQLWRHFVDKYDLINAIYKSKYKKELDRKTTLQYFNNFKIKAKNFQKRIEERKKREKIRKNHGYTNLQERFILSKKDMPLYWLSSEFNKAFKTKITRNGIRDKRLRLLKKKL